VVLLSPPPEILASFGIASNQPFRRTTGGHINDTFIFGEPPAFVVQRISRTYFDDPEAVMENLVRIVGHLSWKVRFDDEAPNERWFPELHNTTTGKPYLYAEDGSLWRALRYIPGRAPTLKSSPELMTNVASMYGRFLAGVEDLGGPELRPTVGWYRDLDAIRDRFESLLGAASTNQLAAIETDRANLAELERWVMDREATLDPAAFRRRTAAELLRSSTLTWPWKDAQVMTSATSFGRQTSPVVIRTERLIRLCSVRSRRVLFVGQDRRSPMPRSPRYPEPGPASVLSSACVTSWTSCPRRLLCNPIRSLR